MTDISADETAAAAFERPQSWPEGTVDLGIGFPFRSLEEKKATYAFMRPLYKDAETIEAMEFPAEYMFKDVPDVLDPSIDPIDWTLAAMDRWNIEIGMSGMGEMGIEAQERYPDRICLSFEVRDIHDPVKQARAIEAAKRNHDIVAVGCFPSGLFPQEGIASALMYPVYAKCCELDIPIAINAGIVGPRMPSSPQYVEQLDRVCYDFPDLTIVTRHGCEPWEKLAMKLMLKWPGLHYCTSAFAPKHYPKEIVKYANSRGADKVMYCGYFPAGISLERQFNDMATYNPFNDAVWPKFLRENAIGAFRLERRFPHLAAAAVGGE
jgi:predicted TIM-barrel fold metal-dependent hydrolase